MKKHKTKPPRWCHGSDGWEFSKDSGCYYKSNEGFVGNPPNEYCLGDRYIHCDYGIDSYGILWRGSTSENWHGYNFGYDLKKAIDWVKKTKHAELGAELWSGPENK